MDSEREVPMNTQHTLNITQKNADIADAGGSGHHPHEGRETAAHHHHHGRNTAPHAPHASGGLHASHTGQFRVSVVNEQGEATSTQPLPPMGRDTHVCGLKMRKTFHRFRQTGYTASRSQ